MRVVSVWCERRAAAAGLAPRLAVLAADAAAGRCGCAVSLCMGELVWIWAGVQQHCMIGAEEVWYCSGCLRSSCTPQHRKRARVLSKMDSAIRYQEGGDDSAQRISGQLAVRSPSTTPSAHHSALCACTLRATRAAAAEQTHPVWPPQGFTRCLLLCACICFSHKIARQACGVEDACCSISMRVNSCCCTFVLDEHRQGPLVVTGW